MGSWRLHKCSKGFVWFAGFLVWVCYLFIYFQVRKEIPSGCLQNAPRNLGIYLATHPTYAGQISGDPLV